MIQQAHEAYNAQDYAKAFTLYEGLAANGDATAMTSLAFMYQNGFGVEKSDEKALASYLQAAEQKQPYALFNLALFGLLSTGCRAETALCPF